MKRYMDDDISFWGSIIVVFSLLLVFEIISFFVGGFCWSYSIRQWAIYLHKDVNISFLQAGLISLIPIIGQLAAPVACVTFIFMSFFH